MNSKNIKKHLQYKLNKWVGSIDDEKVVTAIKKDALITGGCLVSLLNGEEPNDYDIYFRTMSTCDLVARYYARKWNEVKKTKVDIISKNNRVECFISSKGVAVDENETAIDDDTEPKEIIDEQIVNEVSNEEKPTYRARYFSTNAISLSDKIQIVIRFFGEVEDIHKNYDFIHCTCSYDWFNNELNLPSKALEAIINKELYYTGSKYPLCSIIRTRKFISRGWTINAGQYLKMALQLNELNLKDLNTFKEQLVGVDSAYFEECIANIIDRQKEDKTFEITNDYLFELINRIF